MTDARASLLSNLRRARKVCVAELERAGATKDQAFVMALEEAWERAERENQSLRRRLLDRDGDPLRCPS